MRLIDGDLLYSLVEHFAEHPDPKHISFKDQVLLAIRGLHEYKINEKGDEDNET